MDDAHTLKINQILDFWLGHVEQSIVPDVNRVRIWFGEDPEVDQQIREQFSFDHDKALAGEYESWNETGRGQLALILLFDQFSRHIFRGSARAYAQDEQALMLMNAGMATQKDRELSLIERVFYYFPLLHSENLENQRQSVHAYNQLKSIALEDRKSVV